MYINKVISIHSGWECLQDRDEAVDELTKLLEDVTYQNLLESEHKNKTNIPQSKIRLITVNKELKNSAKRYRWRLNNRDRKSGAVPDINNLKYGVSLDFSIAAGTNIEKNIDRWCLFDCVNNQNYDECDISVLIVFDFIPSWIHGTPYMNNLNYNSDEVIDHINSYLMPIYHSNPMVILTISEENPSIEVIELVNNKNQVLERVLEFSPENYQAGVGILSYFGEVLKQKYPDIEAKVRIEQDDCTVRMTIDTLDGNTDVIEEAFDSYTQVVVHEKEPEELLDNKIQVSELKMHIKMLETQLEHKKELLMLSDERYKNDVVATRNEVEFLRNCIRDQVKLTHGSQLIVKQQIEKEEKVTLAQIHNHNTTIQMLIERNVGNQKLADALYKIESMLNQEVKEEHKEISKLALTTIHNESPKVYEQLYELLKNSMYGVSGNIIFSWMNEISKLLS